MRGLDTACPVSVGGWSQSYDGRRLMPASKRAREYVERLAVGADAGIPDAAGFGGWLVKKSPLMLRYARKADGGSWSARQGDSVLKLTTVFW